MTVFTEQDYERAQQLAELELQQGLKRLRQQQSQRPALSHCEECGDAIPLERQQAVNARLCMPCQQDQDARNRRL
jgi:RNA polymerase-binding transcription factor DksA